MDWDKKFSTIVNETEANLDRVRRRIDAARSFAGIETFTPSVFETFNKKYPDVVKKTVTTTQASGDPLTAQNHYQMSKNSGPPVWVTVLDEKLIKQNKTIELLTETVRSLQKDKEKQTTIINELRDKLGEIQERLVEKGVHLDTENKIQQLKHQTTHDINDLKQQVRHYKQTDSSNIHSSNSLEELKSQIRDAKTSCRDETENARRELDYYKTRMTRLERNIAALGENVEDLGRKHQDLKTTIVDLSDRSRNDYRELANTISERLVDLSRNEVSALRNEHTDVHPQSKSHASTTHHLSITRPVVGGDKSILRQPAQWRELLSHSLSTISIDSSDSTLSSGYLARKRSQDSNNEESGLLIAGGLVDSSDDDADLKPLPADRDSLLSSSGSSSPNSLMSINDL